MLLLGASYIAQGDRMPRTCVMLSKDSLVYLKEQNDCRTRGMSAYLEALVQVDKAKRELRQQWAQEQELSSRESWRQSGCNVD